jgi:hypothetical protein
LNDFRVHVLLFLSRGGGFAAPSIEVRDFEEEKPLDQCQYRFGSSRRAGGLR